MFFFQIFVLLNLNLNSGKSSPLRISRMSLLRRGSPFQRILKSLKLIYKKKILFKTKIQISRVKNALTCTTGGGVGCRLFLVAGARIGSSCAARFGGASPIPAILSFSLFFFWARSFLPFFSPLFTFSGSAALGFRAWPIEEAKLD